MLGLILAIADALPPDSASRSSESFEAGPDRKRTNRDYGGYSDDYHGGYAAYGKAEHDSSHSLEYSGEYGKSFDGYASHYSEPNYYKEDTNHLYGGHDYIPSTHATYELQKSLEYSFPSHDSYNHYRPLAPHPPQLNAHQLAGGYHSYNYNDIFGPPYAPTLPVKTTIKTTKRPAQQNNNILSALLSISQSSSGISKPAPTTQKPVQPPPKAHVYSIASYPTHHYSGYPAYHTGQLGYPEPRLTLSHASSSALY